MPIMPMLALIHLKLTFYGGYRSNVLVKTIFTIESCIIYIWILYRSHHEGVSKLPSQRPILRRGATIDENFTRKFKEFQRGLNEPIINFRDVNPVRTFHSIQSIDKITASDWICLATVRGILEWNNNSERQVFGHLSSHLKNATTGSVRISSK